MGFAAEEEGLMSKSEVDRFVTEANQNTEIQNDLLQRVEAPALVEVGNRHGFDFTEDDVRAFAGEQSPPPSGDEAKLSRVFRITNIRANANGITGGGPAPGSVVA